MRLIDADALKDGLCRECTLYGKEECLEAKGEECDWDSIGHINAAKTIDAVPVVRCKDCKFFRMSTYGIEDNTRLFVLKYDGCAIWGNNAKKTIRNGFCFLGEKREDKDDTD